MRGVGAGIAAGIVLAATWTGAAAAQGPAAPEDGGPLGPSRVYADGPSGRLLLDGRWLLRRDPQDAGLRARWQGERGATAWEPIAVPNAWNTGDHSFQSMRGGVAWYRRDLVIPRAPAGTIWLVRFNSVNLRARVWLDGREIGRHTGAFLPFELPLRGARAGRLSRLVVRVDNRRKRSDFPPRSELPDGTPGGGWWNYGGILREVELRPVRRADVPQAWVVPRRRGGRWQVTVRATVRSWSARRERVAVTATLGKKRIPLGRPVLAPGAATTLARTVTLRSPRLWSPGSPSLYPLAVAAYSRGRRVAVHSSRVGIREFAVRSGRLRLNGRPLTVRGFGLHEDSRERGMAIGPAERTAIVDRVRALGGTTLRAHYPLHPQILELADRLGMLVWSEIPVYSVPTAELNKPSVRGAATAMAVDNVRANAGHASIFTWSVGNELSSVPGHAQGSYFKAASAAIRALDSRPISLAIAATPSVSCQSEYRSLDLLGFNEYFGWYVGRGGQVADRDRLDPWLAATRRCYRRQAMMISEFGAEANREGPVEERGTYAFQQDFIRFHMGVFARHPWLSGTLYWALQEFRVRPNWDGGNPHPEPPIHQKGVLDFEGSPKPAAADIRALFAGR